MLSGHGKAEKKCLSGGETVLHKEAKSMNKNLALGDVTGTSTRLESCGEIIRFFPSVQK